jgi:hypothetical protein
VGPPRRVLLVIDSLDGGGAERYVVDLAIALRSRGWDVGVACSAAGVRAGQLFAATQDVHDGDVRGGHVDPGTPGIWRRVGGHGGGDLVRVSRRGEQLAAVSVAGPVAGMAVPGTGSR